jgi:hypothetical protein
MDSYARGTLKAHSKEVVARGQSLSPFDTAIHYDYLPAFVLATKYCLYRILVCGLIETLEKLCVPGELPLDMTAIQEADISAATSIFKSLDYALQSDPKRPLTCLEIIMPLQFGFGSWDRLAKRQRSASSQEYLRAVTMRNRDLEVIDQLLRLWNGSVEQSKRRQAVCAMFAGGPLVAASDAYSTAVCCLQFHPV